MQALNALKARLLNLAIRGMLVPQIDNEAEVEQIGAAPKEAPFEIPKKWKWVKIESLIKKSYGGGTPSRMNPDFWNGDIPWASVKDLSEDFLSCTKESITQEGVKNSSTNIVPANNVIMCSRMALGKIVINKIEVAINQDLKVLELDESSVTKEFFITFYKTINFAEISSGTTVKGVDFKKFKNLSIPLPPLDEQRRIAEKLECLFAKIDTIQKSMGELSQLSASLEKQVLQSAVGGKLVPQLEKEPEVKQIGEAPEEVPFKIPEKWKWTRLDLIAKIISGRDLPKSEIIETPATIPYITGASQFGSTGIIANRWTDKPVVISEKNDLLLTVKGTVGKLAINKIGKVHIARQIAAIRPIKPSVVLTEYLFIYFQNISSLLARSANGMIPGIGRKDIVNRLIPLPPLEEQRRIIAKLNKLTLEIQKLK